MKSLNNDAILVGRKVDCIIFHYPKGKLPKDATGDEEWGAMRNSSIPQIDYEEEHKNK